MTIIRYGGGVVEGPMPGITDPRTSQVSADIGHFINHHILVQLKVTLHHCFRQGIDQKLFVCVDVDVDFHLICTLLFCQREQVSVLQTQLTDPSIAFFQAINIDQLIKMSVFLAIHEELTRTNCSKKIR